MDNVQNCDSYINIPSSQTYRSYLKHNKINNYILGNYFTFSNIFWASNSGLQRKPKCPPFIMHIVSECMYNLYNLVVYCRNCSLVSFM
jgi:hypothetical protein